MGSSVARGRANGGNGTIDGGYDERYADCLLCGPVVSGADCFDPWVRMGLLAGAVRRETERMQGVPQAPIDELQERELCGGHDTAAQPGMGEDGHQGWGSEPMPGSKG